MVAINCICTHRHRNRGGGRGAEPPHYFQKHVLAPPLFGASTSSQSAKVIYTQKYIPPYEKPYNRHTKALWGVASPVHRNFQAVHCMIK